MTCFVTNNFNVWLSNAIPEFRLVAKILSLRLLPEKLRTEQKETSFSNGPHDTRPNFRRTLEISIRRRVPRRRLILDRARDDVNAS